MPSLHNARAAAPRASSHGVPDSRSDICPSSTHRRLPRRPTATHLDPIVARHWKAIQVRIRELLTDEEQPPFSADLRDHFAWLLRLDLEECIVRYRRRRRRRDAVKALLRRWPELVRLVMDTERRTRRAAR